ncbi:membrane dipeptidase [Halioglobus maricola]|uniref:Membrane dipeptidase n=1 Tax=Halioglobus maricola TaxID=2601894 RepID=A0A5P9NG69_9GAMM|nr:dipeptidase [Halioglobus maricola]QFU74529.1 membrane dipeptidase [Halioglobus maricola]
MPMTPFLPTAIFAAVLAATPALASDPAAASLHERLLTIDTHIDVPTSLGTTAADPRLHGPMQVDLPKMREGGLDAGFFIVYVGQRSVDAAGYQQAYEKAQAKFDAIERMLANSPDEIVLVRNPTELRAAAADGKLVAAIGVENAYPLGPNHEHLQEFYDRGARYISLTHFGNNHFGESSKAFGEDGEPEVTGLTDRGLALIDDMNRLGIMVDVSHTSHQSTMDAVARSKTPVIASHSGVAALYAHNRNLSDDAIKAIAARGGVVQLVAFDRYMRDISEEERDAQKTILKDLGIDPRGMKDVTQEQFGELRSRNAALNAKYPKASVTTLIDHVDHVVELVGVDHAGISSDFGGGGGIHGWWSIDESLILTEEMLKRGYSETDIRKIWGENLLRVWEAVEQHAHGS